MSDRALSERIRALMGWFDPEFSPQAQVVNGLANEVRDLEAPAPQIIRTVEELEALDPLTVVYTPNRDSPVFVGDFVADIHYDPDYADDLPAVVVTSGEHVRACREALEGETT